MTRCIFSNAHMVTIFFSDLKLNCDILQYNTADLDAGMKNHLIRTTTYEILLIAYALYVFRYSNYIYSKVCKFAFGSHCFAIDTLISKIEDAVQQIRIQHTHKNHIRTPH